MEARLRLQWILFNMMPEHVKGNRDKVAAVLGTSLPVVTKRSIQRRGRSRGAKERGAVALATSYKGLG